MKIRTVVSGIVLLAAPVFLGRQARAPQPAPAPCVAGNTQFVCGQNAPEDLAVVPRAAVAREREPELLVEEAVRLFN